MAQRIHLPVYMGRWLALVAVSFATAMCIEAAIGARASAALFYVAWVLAAVLESVADTPCLFLRRPRGSMPG